MNSETNKPERASRLHWLLVFMRAQLSAFVGGLCDYAIMISLTEWGGLFYSFSIIISGLMGAVVNYSVNRWWTFRATETAVGTQLQRFIFVVLGSVLLKSSGTYLLTELLEFDYRISRLCVDAVTSLGFNFLLQKYWVFRRK